LRNATLKRDDQARLTEKESVALFLIARAFRVLSQELRQRQGRQGDHVDVIVSGNQFIDLIFVKDHNLANQ